MDYEVLVNGIRNKNEDAINEFYHEFYRDVYYVCLKITENEKDAEDISQEVLFRAINKIELLHTPSGLPAWLRTIANNLSINYIKKNRKFDMVDINSDDEEDIYNDKASDEKTPEEMVADKEVSEILLSMIEKLPSEQRITIFMFYFEEMSVRDISEAMDCSEATVRSRINYAKKALRKQVEELEDKGVKLRCIAILPFLGAIYSFEKNTVVKQIALPAVHNAAKNQMTNMSDNSSVEISQNINNDISNSKLGKEIVKMNKKSGIGLGAKIGIGIAGAAVVIGGIVAAVVLGGKGENSKGTGNNGGSNGSGSLAGYESIETEPTYELTFAGIFGDIDLGVSYKVPSVDFTRASSGRDYRKGTWLFPDGALHYLTNGDEITVVKGPKSFDDIDTMFVDCYAKVGSEFGTLNELDRIKITSKKKVAIGDKKAVYYEGTCDENNEVAGYVVEFDGQLINVNVWHFIYENRSINEGLEYAVQMILSLEDYEGKAMCELGKENELSNIFRLDKEVQIGSSTVKLNYPGQSQLVEDNYPIMMDGFWPYIGRMELNVIEEESVVNASNLPQAMWDYTVNDGSFMIEDTRMDVKSTEKVTISGIEMDKYVIVDYYTGKSTMEVPLQVTVMYSFVKEGKLVFVFDTQEMYDASDVSDWNKNDIPTDEKMAEELEKNTLEAEKTAGTIIRNIEVK